MSTGHERHNTILIMKPADSAGKVEMVPSNYRMKFSGKPVVFELQSAASLKVPRAEMQKRVCSGSAPPRILLGINLSGIPLRHPAIIPPVAVSNNLAVFRCLSMSAWRWE